MPRNDPGRRSRKTKPPELGGTTGASRGINGLSQDVNSYGSRKRRTNETARYLAGGSSDALSHRLFRCATHLNWRVYPDHDKRLLTAAKFCNLNLLCPNCAHRRAARQAAKVHEKLSHLAERFDYWFVTLTVANGPDLAERFDHLKKSFRVYRRMAKDYRLGKGRFVELGRAEGLAWAFEFTNDGQGWHPHVHLIAALPKGSAPIRYGVMPWSGEISQLRQDWHDITGDSFITHAEPVDMSNPHKSVCELVKYSLKFSDLTIPQTFEAYQVLRGRKLCESSGALRGVALPPGDDLLDAPEELSGAYFDLLFLWHGDAYTLISGSLTPEEVLVENPSGTTGDSYALDAVRFPQGEHHPRDLREAQGTG
jgi:hypothetical protein